MFNTKGDLNKKYNSYDEMISDIYSECMNINKALFVNYYNDEYKAKKKWWQFWKSK
jgi:hypothetical protein